MTELVDIYELGTESHLTFKPDNGEQADGMAFAFIQPDGTVIDTPVPEWDAAELEWAVNIVPAQLGLHGFTWAATGPAFVKSGSFFVTASAIAAETDPPTLTDLWVMVPRTRRAVLGPLRAEQTALDDEELYALVADSISRVILVAPDTFGYKLTPTRRDPLYQAPDRWETDKELTEAAQVVVAAQAALEYWTHALLATKTSQTIKDEAQEWSFSISAQQLRDHLKFLQDERDVALEALGGPAAGLETYTSTLLVRDAATARAIEPWVAGSGFGGQDQDWRFGGGW